MKRRGVGGYCFPTLFIVYTLFLTNQYSCKIPKLKVVFQATLPFDENNAMVTIHVILS